MTNMTLLELGRCAKKAFPGEYDKFSDLGAGIRMEQEYHWLRDLYLPLARRLLRDLDINDVRKRKILTEIIAYLEEND